MKPGWPAFQFSSPPLGRSAELHSAVSPICNRQGVTDSNAPKLADTLQDAILRYGRVQLCATLNTYGRPYPVHGD
jgi:hypothetical protein